MSMQLGDSKEQYEWMLKKIVGGLSLKFTRWGDGEWQCLFKRDGVNCDGHRYFRSLRLRLFDALKTNRESEWIYGMQGKSLRDMGQEIELYLASHNIIEKTWINADIFHDASERDLLRDFWPIVENEECVVVGSEKLIMLKNRLKKMRLIEVPSKNAWLEFDRIAAELTGEQGGNPFVFLCCGPMANVLIDEMEMSFSFLRIFNMGSVFDPYCGLLTRRYHFNVLRKLGGLSNE